MNIPPQNVTGNQANALISTVRFIPPNVKDDDKKLWTHIYPQHSIMMIQVEQPSQVLVGLGQNEKDIGSKYSSQYFPSDNNLIVEGYNVQAVNAYLADQFFSKVKTRLNVQNNPTLEVDIECDYIDHIDLGLELLKQWRIGGIVGTPPADIIDINNINRERHIVTFVRGHSFCENIWGEHIYGGDYGFLVGKMVPMEVRLIVNNQIQYGLTNSRVAHVEMPRFKNVVHYVPQFVAITSKWNTVPIDMLVFSVKNENQSEESIRLGVPKLVGRCDQNSQFRETFFSVGDKRARVTIGVPLSENQDNLALCFETPLNNMQQVMNRMTIHMNYMVTI